MVMRRTRRHYHYRRRRYYYRLRNHCRRRRYYYRLRGNCRIDRPKRCSYQADNVSGQTDPAAVIPVVTVVRRSRQ